MKFYDILFLLDQDQSFSKVLWGSPQAQSLYGELFSSWIAGKLKPSKVFSISEKEQSGTFIWDEDHFSYTKLAAPDGCFYLLLSKRYDREFLLARAMDLIPDGIQIYDKNACSVFLNQPSRRISQIPGDMKVEGRHLLDMYDLDENVSTIMTCLRTQSPVVNRVDHYKSSDGVTITTANTAYPIRRGRELVGSVVFEQNSDIVSACRQRMEEIHQALIHYEGQTRHTRFSGYTFDHIIGHGEKMMKSVEIARKVAQQNSTILLVGETGTGKEIFAQSIHRASGRRNGKFVALNCAAIPESLIESLLFGTRKGSFTGSEDKPGYFEEAENGTLFLDELNSMSLGMQSKILRALQENTFRRIGSQKDIKMNVRIISSCNEDPFRSIADNLLRKDLFYRLSTVMIELPPLREHREDLEDLIRYHLNATSYQYVHTVSAIQPQVTELFKGYSWPGNVRELFHVLDYAQNVADGDVLCMEHLPSYLTKQSRMHRQDGGTSVMNEAEPAQGMAPAQPIDFNSHTLQSLLDEYEHKIIKDALEHYGYNITRTAAALNLRRQSLQYRIRKYGIVM